MKTKNIQFEWYNPTQCMFSRPLSLAMSRSKALKTLRWCGNDGDESHLAIGAFWGLHFFTAGKWFIINTSSHRIKLIKQLFSWFIQNQAQALLPSPSQRGSLHLIGQIYASHAVGAANGSPLWLCLLLSCAGRRWYFPYYFYHKKATKQEFFLPAQTFIGVILLSTYY